MPNKFIKGILFLFPIYFYLENWKDYLHLQPWWQIVKLFWNGSVLSLEVEGYFLARAGYKTCTSLVCGFRDAGERKRLLAWSRFWSRSFRALCDPEWLSVWCESDLHLVLFCARRASCDARKVKGDLFTFAFIHKVPISRATDLPAITKPSGNRSHASSQSQLLRIFITQLPLSLFLNYITVRNFMKVLILKHVICGFALRFAN